MTMNPFGENTYIIYNELKECIIVDAGMYSDSEKERFEAFITKNELTPILALNTHGHIDHICGVEWVKSKYGIPFAIHKHDVAVVESVVSYGQGLGFDIQTAPKVDQTIQDGQTITLGNDSIRVIHTPGHTEGGVCFLIEGQAMLLTGDTLFKESIGRTDLPGGNYDTLMRSIVGKILPLGGDVTFFPGHGTQSTIGYEMQRNPFITEVLSGDMSFKQ